MGGLTANVSDECAEKFREYVARMEKSQSEVLVMLVILFNRLNESGVFANIQITAIKQEKAVQEIMYNILKFGVGKDE